MNIHLHPDILECKVKWALGSITKNKASGGDGIPAELFQILKDDAVKVLHSVCQQIWKTKQWLGRKVMTKLDNIFKSRDITLPTKVHLVKVMVFSRGHVWM